MCIPAGTAALGITNTLMSAIGGVSDFATQKANSEYRIQAAMNNAQTAHNEALRQKQLGIDEARKEKLQGISDMSQMQAKNAAGGFSLDSLTSNQNYEDILKNASSNADTIKKNYDLRADSYFDATNNYLNEAKQHQKDYKKNLYATAINGLVSTTSVASSWYKKWDEKGNTHSQNSNTTNGGQK